MISGGIVRADPSIIRKGSFVAAITIAVCLLSVDSYATPSVLLDPERQLQFAEHYFQEGEYYRAIGEYERFIYFFPEDKHVELARYRIGLAYLKGERYQEAIKAFKRLIDEYKTSAHSISSHLRISEAYVHLRDYDEALKYIENVINISPDQGIKDEAYYQCGWINLEKGLWEYAQTCFDKISATSRNKYRLEKLQKELDKKKLLKHKSPFIAGFLAIVPGSGHLYCKRYRDALVSFLVNGALIFAAYEAFDNDLNALGGIISFVEVGFYSGNFYSAISSAHKFNRDEKVRFFRYLKDHTKLNISLGGPKGNKALMLSCRLSF